MGTILLVVKDLIRSAKKDTSNKKKKQESPCLGRRGKAIFGEGDNKTRKGRYRGQEKQKKRAEGATC